MGVEKPGKILRVVNLISGEGSTNLAVLAAEKPGNMLEGLTKTVAIISSDPKASGIQRAIEIGFPAGLIFSVRPEEKGLSAGLLEIFDTYKPDYFHQLGWIPLMPGEVLEKYRGLNQHFGPGGRWMYGIRRLYAHKLFCEMLGEERPIPVLCQLVDTQFDTGNIVHLRWENFEPDETLEEAAARILQAEHSVQIEARALLATGHVSFQEVPKIALNKKEEALLLQAKMKAREKYPAPQKLKIPLHL